MKLETLYSAFRDPKVIVALSQSIAYKAQQLDKPLRIMEVCGGHTHTIMKYGLKQLLPENITFVHGPGCPVCVMPKERIDHAITLAQMPNTILATLGDMIRVPGSKGSLATARAEGCDIRALYTPMDVITIANDNPEKKVIFFAIGFETTTPMSAAVVLQAEREKITNLFFHINHVLVPSAINAIMKDGNAEIDAFIGPSHVSVIEGAKIYEPLSKTFQAPIVVSGFEPVDVMQSVKMIIDQVLSYASKVEIQYMRSVSFEGNSVAQQLRHSVFETRNSFRWRGVGEIPHSALQLRSQFEMFDAEKQFSDRLCNLEVEDHKACICGDILKGLSTPKECTLFGTLCTPNNPIGSCMVSDEGACNAYYKYDEVVNG